METSALNSPLVDTEVSNAASEAINGWTTVAHINATNRQGTT